VVIEFPQAIEGNIIKLPFCGGLPRNGRAVVAAAPQGKADRSFDR
jgi:hypothetical protein